MLIPDWRRAWRYITVQIGTLALGWGMLDAATQAAILEWAGIPPERLPAVIGLCVIAGRMVSQSKKEQA